MAGYGTGSRTDRRGPGEWRSTLPGERDLDIDIGVSRNIDIKSTSRYPSALPYVHCIVCLICFCRVIPKFCYGHMQKAISGTCHNIGNFAAFGITWKNVARDFAHNYFHQRHPTRSTLPTRLHRARTTCAHPRGAGRAGPCGSVSAMRLHPCAVPRACGLICAWVGAEGWVL